jgi:hypothetical protein
VPDTPITYEDVECLEADGLGYTCQLGTERVFVGKYVSLPGTTIRTQGDRGRLVLPRWFVEQQALPLDRHLSDPEVEQWLATARTNAETAQQNADDHPGDAAAQAALERATAELASAMLLRGRRQRGPR